MNDPVDVQVAVLDPSRHGAESLSAPLHIHDESHLPMEPSELADLGPGGRRTDGAGLGDPGRRAHREWGPATAHKYSRAPTPTGGPALKRSRIPGVATYEAAPNIALVKYWGIRDPARMLPYNSSLSVTLDKFRTRTRVKFVPELLEDRLRLNGRETPGGPLEAVRQFLERVRQRAHLELHAQVESRNNFPTASGLASSASGFAALAGAASRAAGLPEQPSVLSELARFGSGSACRSVYGGFVEWQAGVRPDGRDCYAKPLFGPKHWPELVDAIAIVADAPEKAVRSQDAMQSTVTTSREYGARQRAIPRRISLIRRALRLRSGDALFPLLMEECDEFRHVCETTEPPLDYLTGTSHEILAAVEELNRKEGRAVAGYTHDAGAHVHVFTVRKDLARLRATLASIRGIRRLLVVAPGPGGRYVGGRAGTKRPRTPGARS